MSEQQVIDLLRKRVTTAGGQRAWSRLYGFSAAYVNDVLLGRRAPAEKICAAIGITRAVTYAVAYRKRK